MRHKDFCKFIICLISKFPSPSTGDPTSSQEHKNLTPLQNYSSLGRYSWETSKWLFKLATGKSFINCFASQCKYCHCYCKWQENCHSGGRWGHIDTDLYLRLEPPSPQYWFWCSKDLYIEPTTLQRQEARWVLYILECTAETVKKWALYECSCLVMGIYVERDPWNRERRTR